MANEGERGLVLINAAAKAGALTDRSKQALEKAASNAPLALGTPMSGNRGENRVLFGCLLDDSESLNVIVKLNQQVERNFGSRYTTTSADPKDSSSNAGILRNGYNQIIKDVLRASGLGDKIWVHTKKINGGEINPWVPLAQVPLLNTENYLAGGSTPLRDALVPFLGETLSKSQEVRNLWMTPRTITMIITDGVDVGSVRHSVEETRSVVTDIDKPGSIHLVAALAIEDGYADPKGELKRLGLRDELILSAGSSPAEIIKALGIIGNLVRRASDPGKFTQLKQDGFLALPPGER